ncbi:RNA-dependent RNA polymerase 2 [Cucurbita pepo subsp. pepo]|uniref:RNA-dependent RNA polymerase 2 n=1 Tax=Cucurbita pepo subsp. pepo TaxID=3664 RepID=UPI000C9D33D3|nr:RNA-dependent RNA polymerase 2 [Cucurbita pepo subsp. pepo]
MGQPKRSTLRVSNVPESAVAEDLLTFLKSKLGPDSVFAIEIFTERKNWKSRGSGRVQFTTLEAKSKAQSLSVQNNLVFNTHNLRFSETNDDIIVRPIHARNRTENGVLHVGFMLKEDHMSVLESWEGVKAWIMPERRRVEFWIWHEDECYKLEVMFEEILETTGYCLGDEKLNALLLKLKYAPRIYKRISGSNMASKFSSSRYRLCKEEHDYLWIRTTEFSSLRSIGQSTSFCWEVEEDLQASDIFSSFPLYRETPKDITLEDGGEFGSTSEAVPLIKSGLVSNLAYELQYQLNSLVHMQKISLAAASNDLIEFLSTLGTDTALNILQRLHQLKFICYDPLSFLKTQLHVLKRNCKVLPSLSQKRLSNNVMNCYRVLVTPSRIYCLGPELETSNYVVKNFASYASDFMRVTFVEEDWSKLPAGAVTTSIQRGLLSKPYRTEIYHRIVSILRNGIVIGAKRFEFLAFSASQLRSNSVWMFASSDNLKAEEIRQWMGCFEKIRSISKCAARMGQLFSSSTQTLVVPTQDVEIIPDIEVNSDGIDYCFSDGIGKISLSFARQVADKCGLTHIPSAFQIRYGGYKGVIAVDRNSFRKLSLRDSMLKFESKNKMLNVTKCSDSMPCYLNREIVTLLSTLGVKDESFEALQQEQLHLLRRMLTDKVAALNVLENLNGADSNNILVQMLNHGYEPNIEPYLSMMLQAHYWNLFSDLRSRCRIFVPKGRILLGCLDETGILNYGQVYACITLTKSELRDRNQNYFHKIDETKSILLGKVVVTKNPCLHPGDVRVLEAIFHVELEEKGLVDCLIFPQKGERPHTNECSGGDLDGDLYFISWDENLIPPKTEAPMDYTGRRPRIMDHDVTLEEIQKFFVDYMINDTLGAISTAHLVHADREPKKALSSKCLELAALHSMAVDYAKTGAPAEMPRVLKPREFPDFMERFDKPMYKSNNVLGKLYRAAVKTMEQERSRLVWTEETARAIYDHDLEVDGFEAFLETAESFKVMYIEKMSILMNYYGAEFEDEILMGDLRSRASYLQRDNRKYGDMKDRILLSVKCVRKEAKEWFENSCAPHEHKMMASAWYHVTYHPSYFKQDMFYFSFPWIVHDVLLNIKAMNSKRREAEKNL